MKLDQLFSIEGKTSVVTGGSRGIGEMITAGFLANGVKVYITARKAGPLIDKISVKGDENKFKFPLPKVNGGDISYSGTKTAFINFLNKNQTKNIEFINQNINDICASIQKNLIDNLMNKVHLLSAENNLKTIVFGGGVSANSYLKKRLEKYSNENDLKIFIPELQFSTDNAAMIGIVGYLKYKYSLKSNLKSTPSPRLSF